MAECRSPSNIPSCPRCIWKPIFFRNLLFLLLPLISTRRVYADAECLILNSCTTRTRTRKNKTYNTSNSAANEKRFQILKKGNSRGPRLKMDR